MIKRVIIMFMVVVVATSCFQETAYNTNLTIRPYEQSASGEDYVELEGVIAYTFDADPDEWEVESYANAAAGIITSIESGTQMGPIGWSSAVSGSSSLVSMTLEQELVFMVIVDTKNKMYAYSEFDIGINLYDLYLAVVFMPWKTANYTSSGWTYMIPETE